MAVVAGMAASVAVAACLPDPGPSSPLVGKDVAAAAGIARTVPTQGENCVFDYDVDGHLDLLLSTHGIDRWQLFKGRGDGTFYETNVGTFTRRDRHGCAVADFNADTLPDIYTSIGACMGTCSAPHPKELWIQQPDHTFVNQAATWGVTDVHGRGREPVALHANVDTLPDLFTGQEIGINYPSPNRLYLNVGGTTFVQPTGPPSERSGGDCVDAADYDGDGFEDLVVCAKDAARLYHNQAGLSFIDTTSAVGLPISYTRDAEFDDINGDGLLDLVIVRATSVEVRLNTSGQFPSVTYSFALKQGRDVAMGDVDLDGDHDIYVVQGDNSLYPDYLLLNNGQATGFSQAAIPQVTSGNGDRAQAIPNWKGTGRVAFLVNNGIWTSSGPRQLIEFTGGTPTSTTTTTSTTSTTEPPTSTTSTTEPPSSTTTVPEETTTTTVPEETTTTTVPEETTTTTTEASDETTTTSTEPPPAPP